MDGWNSTQVSVFAGRGVLVEGANSWLYATAAEHHALYQYQVAGARAVLAGFAQTETPYWQPAPDARAQPFPVSAVLRDPDYAALCANATAPCAALGLRVLDAVDVRVYGAGLYSVFDNYSTACSTQAGPEDCQAHVFAVDGDVEGLVVYGLSMVTTNGTGIARAADNVNVFSDAVMLFVP